MSQSAIDDQDAYIAAVGDIFNQGDATIGQLIASLGGNPVAFSSGILQDGGDAGVPTLGDPLSLDSLPASSARRYIVERNRRLFGGGVEGGGIPNGVPQALRSGRRSGGDCGPPEVLPLVTVFPIPLATESGSPPGVGDGLPTSAGPPVGCVVALLALAAGAMYAFSKGH
jgi:hypothetical protein